MWSYFDWYIPLKTCLRLVFQIRSRNANEIIFGLNDGYYAAEFDQKVFFLTPGNGTKINSRPSSDLVIYQCLNSVPPLLREESAVWFFFFVLQETLDRKKNSLLHVDQSSVRNSYSVFSLLRWVTLFKGNIEWKHGFCMWNCIMSYL